MTEKVRITVLVENTAERAGLLAEHGLAYWIEVGSSGFSPCCRSQRRSWSPPARATGERAVAATSSPVRYGAMLRHVASTAATAATASPTALAAVSPASIHRFNHPRAYHVVSLRQLHRVLARSMAQTGWPKGDGTGGPGYWIDCECYRSDHRFHFRGSLAMAHSGPDTGGSQFYLTFLPARQLDGNHTVFGRVIRGIEVLARLERRDPPDPASLRINPFPTVTIPPADRILEAKVVRKRNQPYVPKVRRFLENQENQGADAGQSAMSDEETP